MKEKCYYHYIIKDTIKPPLSQEIWEVFSLFFKKSPPKEQAFVRLSHLDRGQGPRPMDPLAEGDVWTPFRQRESPQLSPFRLPWVLVRLSSSLGRLLKGIHPLSCPIAWPGKAAGQAAAIKKDPKGPHTLSAPTDSPGRARSEFRRPQPAEKTIIFSPGMYRENNSSPGAGFAGGSCISNFGRGLTPSRILDTPRTLPPQRSANPSPLPKFNTQNGSDHRKRF